MDDDDGAGDEEMYGLDSTGIVVAELAAIGAGPSGANSEVREPKFGVKWGGGGCELIGTVIQSSLGGATSFGSSFG